MTDLERPDGDAPSSAPHTFNVACRAFASENDARAVGQAVGDCIRIIGIHIDLARLDGVTVAYDYGEALASLDRGYTTSHVLKPSEGDTVGVAMTPSVLRDGELKSHIVFHADYVRGIAAPNDSAFKPALHVIAHECAHVEVTSRYDTAFPGRLLRTTYSDAWSAARGQVVADCWNEYAASRISACFGTAPTDAYEDSFLQSLSSTRAACNSRIKAYRVHHDTGTVLSDVFAACGQLIKLTAYHLGNLDGLGLDVTARPTTTAALSQSWFAPYFDRLHATCRGCFETYGRWSDDGLFNAIGAIADDVVSERGLHPRYMTDGSVYVDVPFTSETMPGPFDHLWQR